MVWGGQCEEYKDKAHALLMEKLYSQDDESSAVMAEIMRAEVTRGQYPHAPTLIHIYT